MLTVPLALIAASLTLPMAGAAQAPAASGPGTCSLRRAEAGAALPCTDGSAVASNPAGIDARSGAVLSIGASGAGATGGYRSDRLAVEQPVDVSPRLFPSAFLAAPLSRRIAVGLGTWAPWSIGQTWGESFDGRFVALDSEILVRDVQAAVAVHLGNLAVGGGPTLVTGTFRLRQRLDLSDQLAFSFPPVSFEELGIPHHTDFADVLVTSSTAAAAGATLGIRFRATGWLSLGGRYRAPVALAWDAAAEFTQAPTGLVLPEGNLIGLPGGTPVDAVVSGAFRTGGTLLDQNAAVSVDLPAELVAGIALRPGAGLLILADYVWTGWSRLQSIDINYANAATRDARIGLDLRDTHGVRAAAELRLSERVDVSGGWSFTSALAAPGSATPLIPTGSHHGLSLGSRFALSPRLHMDLAWSYRDAHARRGFRDGGDAADGLYDVDAHVLGAGLVVGL